MMNSGSLGMRFAIVASGQYRAREKGSHSLGLKVEQKINPKGIIRNLEIRNTNALATSG